MKTQFDEVSDRACGDCQADGTGAGVGGGRGPASYLKGLVMP